MTSTGHGLWLYQNNTCEMTQSPKRSYGSQTLLFTMHSEYTLEVSALQQAIPFLELPGIGNNWTSLSNSADQLLYEDLVGPHRPLPVKLCSLPLPLPCLLLLLHNINICRLSQRALKSWRRLFLLCLFPHSYVHMHLLLLPLLISQSYNYIPRKRIVLSP